MRLGYFTMPLHPLHRDPAVTLQEDREAVILADKLGFHDAFVGEHLTDPEENITNSFIFLATLIGETKAIRLGTGTANLSHSHPALIAAHAAMFDHLAKGRFIFGISPGTLASDAEALGMSLAIEERNRLFSEAIDVILAIWARDAPYDIDFPGNRHGRARLPSDVGEFPAAALAAVALEELRRRQGQGRQEGRPGGLARRPHHLRRRRRQGGRGVRAARC